MYIDRAIPQYRNITLQLQVFLMRDKVRMDIPVIQNVNIKSKVLIIWDLLYIDKGIQNYNPRIESLFLWNLVH